MIESYLRSIAESATTWKRAGMSVHSRWAVLCAPNNEHIPQLLVEYRQGLEDTVAKALATAEEASHHDIDTAALAGYAMT